MRSKKGKQEVLLHYTFRLFGLRNAPYSSGRVLSWRQEIEPVAGGLLRNITTIEDGTLNLP